MDNQKATHPDACSTSKKKRRRGRVKGEGEPTSPDKGHQKPLLSSTTTPSSTKRRKRAPPSREALQLSERLKTLSREKKLDEALALYWDSSNDTIRDVFHVCIVVDLTARCGCIHEGERIIHDMKSRPNQHCNVEIQTALLKGYAHAGKLAQAEALFCDMCRTKIQSDLPNPRTLNTLLRGCLWSAAAASASGDLLDICGGVVTAEKAWSMYKELSMSDDNNTRCTFDISSYEYSITLLCQALRLNDAKSRIEEMKEAFGLGPNDSAASHETDQSLTEALAVAHLALARGNAILGKKMEAVSACKETLSYSSLSQTSLETSSLLSSKRAWKGQQDGGAGEHNNRRAESNAIYRKHRLREMEMEAKTVMEICQKVEEEAFNPRALARRLSTRLVYLSGGGSTESKQGQHKEVGLRDNSTNGVELGKGLQRQIFNSSYFSFGMDAVAQELGVASKPEQHAVALKKKDCNRLLGNFGLQGGIVGNDSSKLDLQRIFSAGIGSGKPSKGRNKKSRPIEVELGAGFGDWIVRKAMVDTTKDYVAVELRADRVAQIFARTTILSMSHPVDNLCIVGADCEAFLRHHLERESVQTIHVNHPEPPTQTFGADDASILSSISKGGPEPAHMLNSRVIALAIQALKRDAISRVVIVTDNKFYGKLISATIAKVQFLHPDLLSCVDLSKLDSRFQTIDSGSSHVFLFEGQPNETIGFPKQTNDTMATATSNTSTTGESYFDRLWRAGGGTHADQQSRFIVVLSPLLKKE